MAHFFIMVLQSYSATCLGDIFKLPRYAATVLYNMDHRCSNYGDTYSRHCRYVSWILSTSIHQWTFEIAEKVLG